MPSNLFADISSNNHKISVEEYADDGHLLLAVKATEGVTYTDPDYHTWVARAHWYKLGVVHYHFARPDLEGGPEHEANHFLSVVKHHLGARDYVALDIERPDIRGWERDPAWTNAFDARVQEVTGKHCVLYTPIEQFKEDAEWLYGGNRRLWVPDWSDKHVRAPRGWSILFRQFTDGVVGPEPHSLRGIGRCDVNMMSKQVHSHLLSMSHCPN